MMAELMGHYDIESLAEAVREEMSENHMLYFIALLLGLRPEDRRDMDKVVEGVRGLGFCPSSDKWQDYNKRLNNNTL